MLIADDNFCVKAVYKPRQTGWKFDWTFREESSDFVPKRPEHLVLRKTVSDILNEAKLKKRPVCNGE